MKKQTETMNAAYEAPQVEVIEVAVEKGYANSDMDYLDGGDL